MPGRIRSIAASSSSIQAIGASGETTTASMGEALSVLAAAVIVSATSSSNASDPSSRWTSSTSVAGPSTSSDRSRRTLLVTAAIPSLRRRRSRPCREQETGQHASETIATVPPVLAVAISARFVLFRHFAGRLLSKAPAARPRESRNRVSPNAACILFRNTALMKPHCWRIPLVAACGSPRPGYFLEPRRSCSRGFRFLILCRDARRSRRVRGGAVPFARIACGGERASPTATGGCEEPVAAQASDVHGLAALDDRAVDEVDGLVAGDGDPGAAGHCASVAPRGLPPSVAMAVTNSRPKAHKLCDADSRDGGTKPKVGR